MKLTPSFQFWLFVARCLLAFAVIKWVVYFSPMNSVLDLPRFGYLYYKSTISWFKLIVRGQECGPLIHFEETIKDVWALLWDQGHLSTEACSHLNIHRILALNLVKMTEYTFEARPSVTQFELMEFIFSDLFLNTLVCISLSFFIVLYFAPPFRFRTWKGLFSSGRGYLRIFVNVLLIVFTALAPIPWIFRLAYFIITIFILKEWRFVRFMLIKRHIYIKSTLDEALNKTKLSYNIQPDFAPPKCKVAMGYIQQGEFYAVGQAMRWTEQLVDGVMTNVFVTAEHVVAHLEESGKENMFLYANGYVAECQRVQSPVKNSFPDLAFISVSDTDCHLLGATKIKLNYPLSTRLMGTVHCSGVGDTWDEYSSGLIEISFEYPFVYTYNGDTKPGFSGAPMCIGSCVVGMHTGGITSVSDSTNHGYLLQPILDVVSRVWTKLAKEDSADIVDQMKDDNGKDWAVKPVQAGPSPTDTALVVFHKGKKAKVFMADDLDDDKLDYLMGYCNECAKCDALRAARKMKAKPRKTTSREASIPVYIGAACNPMPGNPDFPAPSGTQPGQIPISVTDVNGHTFITTASTYEPVSPVNTIVAQAVDAELRKILTLQDEVATSSRLFTEAIIQNQNNPVYQKQLAVDQQCINGFATLISQYLFVLTDLVALHHINSDYDTKQRNRDAKQRKHIAPLPPSPEITDWIRISSGQMISYADNISSQPVRCDVDCDQDPTTGRRYNENVTSPAPKRELIAPPAMLSYLAKMGFQATGVSVSQREDFQQGAAATQPEQPKVATAPPAEKITTSDLPQLSTITHNIGTTLQDSMNNLQSSLNMLLKRSQMNNTNILPRENQPSLNPSGSTQISSSNQEILLTQSQRKNAASLISISSSTLVK